MQISNNDIKLFYDKLCYLHNRQIHDNLKLPKVAREQLIKVRSKIIQITFKDSSQ